MKNAIKNIFRNNKFLYESIRIVFQTVKIIFIISLKILSVIFLVVPLKKNRVVFSNYKGKGLYDNPKYILLELLDRDLDLEVIWFYNNESDVQALKELGVKTIKNTPLNNLYYLSTARLWIDNSRKVHIPIKRKSNIYIQTWHGGLGLKKLESDLEHNTLIEKLVAKWDRKATDYMISNSKHLTDIYRGAFKYEGEILEMGYPSNDILFKSTTRNSDDPITILYAPTFRGNEVGNQLPAYFPNFDRIIHELESKTEMTYNVVVRTHPSININLEDYYDSPSIINGNVYSDFKELSINCDILISDYSSSIFDGLMMKKQTHLYVPDFDEYNSKRGLYYTLEQLPFDASFTEAELVESILKFNKENYLNKRKVYLDLVEVKDDGHASERVVDFIEQKLNL